MTSKSLNKAITAATNNEEGKPGKLPTNDPLKEIGSVNVVDTAPHQVFDPAKEAARLSGEEQVEATPKPTFLTREQFDAEVDAKVAKVIETKLPSFAQSYADKFTNRLKATIEADQKKVKDTIAMQRENGMAISEEQEKALLEKVTLKSISEFEAAAGSSGEPSGTGNPPTTERVTPDESNPVIQNTNAILSSVGVEELLDTEPEWKMLNMDALDKGELTAWYKSVNAAGAAKAARISKVALPTSGNGTPPGDPMDQYAARLQVLLKDPVANMGEINEIRTKIRLQNK